MLQPCKSRRDSIHLVASAPVLQLRVELCHRNLPRLPSLPLPHRIIPIQDWCQRIPSSDHILVSVLRGLRVGSCNRNIPRLPSLPLPHRINPLQDWRQRIPSCDHILVHVLQPCKSGRDGIHPVISTPVLQLRVELYICSLPRLPSLPLSHRIIPLQDWRQRIPSCDHILVHVLQPRKSGRDGIANALDWPPCIHIRVVGRYWKIWLVVVRERGRA